MPRWARFLSCTLTGLLLSLTGFFMAAWWWEGGSGFWNHLLDFMATAEFWHLVSLFALLVGTGLVVARTALHLWGYSDGIAGLLAGGLVAAAYAVFLVSSHAGDWGGMLQGLQKTWPATGLFTAPFAVAGAFTTWLWDRLD